LPTINLEPTIYTKQMPTYLLEIVESYNLYLVAFPEHEEYKSFLVVASNPDEAQNLTPDAKMNKSYGLALGYCFEDEDLREFEPYNTKRIVTLMGEANPTLEWGDVPIVAHKI
jgi:hypothetical protein